MLYIGDGFNVRKIMDTDKIEEGLANFQADPHNVMLAILNSVMKMQATMEIMVIKHVQLMKEVDPSIDEVAAINEIQEGVSANLNEIQIEIASRYL